MEIRRRFSTNLVAIVFGVVICFPARAQAQDDIPPAHRGDWAPVLISPSSTSLGGGNPGVPVNRYPTPQQLEFQERQLGAFIHFGPATYIQSDMMRVPDADIFNPTKLDAEQWVAAAASFGAKHVVLTAKHHNGFCLWPTKTSDYSVRNSPWKDGEGDVVAEFVAACRKHGLKPGLYISAADGYLGCTSTPDPMGERKLVGDIDAYFPRFFEQVRELLTGYGEIDYVWFDGAYDPLGWDVSHPDTGKPLGVAYGEAIRTLITNLQPRAVVFGGTNPDVRWSGSEQGWAPYPLWNVVEPGKQLESWVGPHVTGWIPAEANIHTRDTWFWTPGGDHTLRDVSFMDEVYFQSIGRGANLLINITPDTTGVVPAAEVERLMEFGEHLSRIFGTPVIERFGPAIDEHDYIEIQFPESAIQVIELVEDIEHGQAVTHYVIE
uniref:alpha-L-fucosidase n=1 Tax=Parapedobacter defluvii TaxID=2045106 RepID=UPI003341602C